MRNPQNPPLPQWIPIAGVVIGFLTLIFFMVIVLLSMRDNSQITNATKGLIVFILALGASLSSTFIGGTIAAEGRIPLPGARENPIVFSAAGGIAVLIIILVVGFRLYVPPEAPVDPEPSGSGSTETSPNISTACSPSYDPRAYRPGTSEWTGRVGQIAFNNGTNSPVQVTLYHPDVPDRAFNSWTVQPGQNLFLGSDNYGMDWGIQADSSPICIVGRVSAWNQFNGQFIFQSGFPFQVHN